MDVSLTIPNAERLTAELKSLLENLPDEIKNKAAERAIKRTLDAMKAEGKRIARQEYTAHPNPLFNVRMRREGMHGELVFSGKPGYGLFHFKPIPRALGKRPASGVSTKILKRGSREVRQVPGHDKPFLMALSRDPDNGKLGIFTRPHGSRSGLEFQLGPSPIQAIIAERNKERMQEKVDETFPKRLQHEIDVILSGVIR